MAEPIARIHVNDYDPEVYHGDNALELAMIAADQFRADFPGAVIGVSYNPVAADARRRDIMARLGDPESAVTGRKDGDARRIADGRALGFVQPDDPEFNVSEEADR